MDQSGEFQLTLSHFLNYVPPLLVSDGRRIFVREILS
jgi:hypothetical protein